MDRLENLKDRVATIATPLLTPQVSAKRIADSNFPNLVSFNLVESKFKMLEVGESLEKRIESLKDLMTMLYTDSNFINMCDEKYLTELQDRLWTAVYTLVSELENKIEKGLRNPEGAQKAFKDLVKDYRQLKKYYVSTEDQDPLSPFVKYNTLFAPVESKMQRLREMAIKNREEQIQNKRSEINQNKESLESQIAKLKNAKNQQRVALIRSKGALYVKINKLDPSSSARVTTTAPVGDSLARILRLKAKNQETMNRLRKSPHILEKMKRGIEGFLSATTPEQAQKQMNEEIAIGEKLDTYLDMLAEEGTQLIAQEEQQQKEINRIDNDIAKQEALLKTLNQQLHDLDVMSASLTKVIQDEELVKLIG